MKGIHFPTPPGYNCCHHPCKPPVHANAKAVVGLAAMQQVLEAMHLKGTGTLDKDRVRDLDLHIFKDRVES